MSVINIRPAVREGARLVIGIAGPSGSGKTYSALQLAYGMANGDAMKVGLLDTENKRGSLYADSIKNKDGVVQPFLIGDLYAPFSPKRYAEAIKEFQAAGVEVLVVDSASHEWEGTGGCEEIATETEAKMADWKKAKREHKRFMNTLLTCDMHIIVCIRAREKTSFTDPKKPVSLGLQPIQEKNFMFEMTASLMMYDQGRSQDVLKCPADLQAILGRGNDYLTPRDGLSLRKWVDGAKQADPAVERAKNSILSQCDEGLDAVNRAWQSVPAKIQKALGESFIEMCRDSARAFDDQREQALGLDPISLDSGFDPAKPIERETISMAPQSEPLPEHDGDVFGMNDPE